MLNSFNAPLRACIIGGTGGIGRALVNELIKSEQVETVYSLSRSGAPHASTKVQSIPFDFLNEASLTSAVETLRGTEGFDLIIVATGLLHDDWMAPEKTIRALDMAAMRRSFEVNTMGPALTAKHFLPLLRRDSKAVFAALSARVGSISDNRLGGWYSYRASKAALNMILKTLSIEVSRRFQNQIIIGLHPGTVDTELSLPFQKNVSNGALFTPEFAAKNLLSVVDRVDAKDTGLHFAWDGKQIDF